MHCQHNHTYSADIADIADSDYIVTPLTHIYLQCQQTNIDSADIVDITYCTISYIHSQRTNMDTAHTGDIAHTAINYHILRA